MGRGKQISPRQAAGIITSVLIGVGILTLPREITAAAGTDAHLATLLGGLAATLLIIFFTRLAMRFPEHSLIEYSSLVLGKVPGKVLGGLFIIYWFLLTSAVARVFGEMVIAAVLTRTPLEVTIGSMLFLGAQLATQEVKVFARVYELFLPLTIIPLVVLLLISVPNVKPLHLLPVLAFGPAPLLQGILTTGLSFLGLEAVLVLFPYYSKPEVALRYHLYGIAIPLLVYLLVVILTLGTFGAEGLQTLQWPTLEQIRLAGIPGVFERLESAFVALWVVTAFTTVGGLYLLGVLSICHLLGLKEEHRFWPYLLVPPLFLLARYPQNIIEVGTYVDYIAKGGLVLVVAGPALVFLLALLQGKKGGREQDA